MHSSKKLCIIAYNLVSQRSDMQKPESKCFLKIVPHYTYPIYRQENNKLAKQEWLFTGNSFGE